MRFKLMTILKKICWRTFELLSNLVKELFHQNQGSSEHLFSLLAVYRTDHQEINYSNFHQLFPPSPSSCSRLPKSASDLAALET